MSGRPKLDEAAVLEIRRRHELRQVSQAQSARDFGISKAMVKKIVDRHAWKRVPHQPAIPEHKQEIKMEVPDLPDVQTLPAYQHDLFQPWPFQGMEPHKYGLVIADPPWKFKLYSEKGEAKSPQAHYQCMHLEWIKSLPVAELCLPDAACLCWATAPMLPQALETLEAWGFKFTTAGAWAKQSKTGRFWAFGTGYVLRSASEFFLLGKKGNPKGLSKSVRNLIVAPVRENSRKPPHLHDAAELLFPGPYLEMFARQGRPGWDVWGDQVTKFDGEAA